MKQAIGGDYFISMGICSAVGCKMVATTLILTIDDTRAKPRKNACERRLGENANTDLKKKNRQVPASPKQSKRSKLQGLPAGPTGRSFEFLLPPGPATVI